MIDRTALLADLKKQVGALERDLRERSTDVADFDEALRGEWRSACEKQRTAATFESWREGQITQSAVAWVLGTVFLRFCEDNGLIDLPYLAGAGERLAIAKERQQAYFEDPENVEKTDREWIEAGFKAMSDASPVAAGLFDRAHNPMWRITPSLETAKALIAFWRVQGDDSEIVHDFTDPDWNTRFLGDLYQDLSVEAKKTYALLQTPEFVEEFILDLTLTPALDEFGLDPEPPETSPVPLPRGLRLIDPTCGSGHFLLGAFHRLLTKWEQQAPAADRWDLINRTLYSVHGVDKNPFAAAIARFRLLLAAMQAGDIKRLADTPDFTINIAIGDSLLHGRGAAGVQGDLLEESEPHTYLNEDIADYAKTVDLLGIGSYHVVVGNPPYITPKDKQENKNYRHYQSCFGTYPLSIPFAERFFQLAIRGGASRVLPGHVGQITANSFMKRGFGKKLIEEFFHTIDLTHVIDTSGAYIPGHGTPTVILIGRRTWPRRGTIRVAINVRGEPGEPEDAAEGLVWKSITKQIDHPDSESDWTVVSDLPREQLSFHPWSLNKGSKADLIKTIRNNSTQKVSQVATPPIGRGVRVGADEAFIRPLRKSIYATAGSVMLREFLLGEALRDWQANPKDVIWYPYTKDIDTERLRRILWPWREVLSRRRTFKGVMADAGLEWWKYMQHTASAYTSQLSIAFAFMATHNHFVLDRGGRIFNRHSPVIKLPPEASEDDHFALLGVLNSSSACFWLKQVCHNKGEGGGARVDAGYSAMGSESWKNVYEFTGGELEKLPLPKKLPLTLGRELDRLAAALKASQPSAICNDGAPTQAKFDSAKTLSNDLLGRMIALQEELDWEVYSLYGLFEEQEAKELKANIGEIPALTLGERAFEIVLARSLAASEIETEWFTRHRSEPITELPPHWPASYRRVVEKRINIIETRRDIALIEQPEYKRRWHSGSWETKEKTALRNWILDQCEQRELWLAPDDMGNQQPRPLTVNRLADHLREKPDFLSVIRMYADTDAEPAAALMEILDTEHVPYLAALRYQDIGLSKRSQWEQVWEQQRKDDTTEERSTIAEPPKYRKTDFSRVSYWSNRGKLDVPKERFISYPGASPDGDGSLLLGWAGWDHREQAHALMTIIDERTTRDGWDKERLIPLIAGLAEVLPWVKQWHGEVDPNFGMSPADAYTAYLEDQQLRHGLTADDLKNWRPPKKRARKPRSPKAD